MAKKNLTKTEKETFLQLIVKLYNTFIFKGFWDEGISSKELAEEMSYRKVNPKILTEKAIIRLVVTFMDQEEKNKDLWPKLSEIKELIQLAKKKGILTPWGQGTKVLPLVTKEYLDVLKNWGENFNAEFGLDEGEELFNAKIDMECPYCQGQTKIPQGEGYSNIDCENCGKEFKLLTGKVKKTRGRLNAVTQFGAEPISITIKMNQQNETINFSTNYRMLISSGDKISFVWKKGWFSGNYKEKPTQICNWESKQIYSI